MKYKEKREDLADLLKPVIHGLGYAAADISLRRARGLLEIHLVLAKRGGVSLNDCALVHSTVLPQLEMEYPDTDIRLEVSSPGIHRNIKTADEFPAYLGMALSILPAHSNDWVRGTLQEVKDEGLMMKIDEQIISFDLDEIRKARLESMEEAVE
ncbi:MAG: hypothetical protein JW760_13795 [Spirochaetales bacterium]|nr:hypothetical protein [Spirochaetales bacterium]